MVVALILLLLTEAFIGLIIWAAAIGAPKRWREKVVIGACALFVTAPSIGLAVGALT